nr:AraC family transcriptional regulator [Burkholderia multivorans]
MKLNELHKNQDFMGFLSARRAADGIGTSFQAIVDDVRCSLAREYLKDTRMNTSDITMLLGFSDGANFRRALKRWTGKTVNDLRR